MFEKIFLTTQDGINIAANLYSIKKPIGWLVLLHMMPATKESWHNFAIEAQKVGYESIAIDLRGHGDSRLRAQTNANLTPTNANILDYKNFSDEEHQKSILDIQTTVDYLINPHTKQSYGVEINKHNATPEKITFIGASIGTSLSLQYITENPKFKTAILLSPGLNYRGIKTELFAVKIKPDQKVFFISTKDDYVRQNAEQTQKLYDLILANKNKKIKIYETGGHGTDILNNQQELINLIIEFLK